MSMGIDEKLWREYESQGWHMTDNFGYIMTNKGFPFNITRWENIHTDEQIFFIIDGDGGYCGAYPTFDDAAVAAEHLAKINSYSTPCL